MPIPAKVKKYLDERGVDYEAIAHKTVFTAYDAAQTLKRSLKEVAKNLLIEADKVHVLVILPADRKVDLKKLKKYLGAKKVSIPKEQIMIKVLKIQPGSLSSFGRLHQLEVLVDKTLLNTKKAVLSTGSFTDSVLMKVRDFIQLEEARLADVAMNAGYKIPKAVKTQMKQAKKIVANKVGRQVAKKNLKKSLDRAVKRIVKKIAPRPVKKILKKPARKAAKKTTGKKK